MLQTHCSAPKSKSSNTEKVCVWCVFGEDQIGATSAGQTYRNGAVKLSGQSISNRLTALSMR